MMVNAVIMVAACCMFAGAGLAMNRMVARRQLCLEGRIAYLEPIGALCFLFGLVFLASIGIVLLVEAVDDDDDWVLLA